MGTPPQVANMEPYSLNWTLEISWDCCYSTSLPDWATGLHHQAGDGISQTYGSEGLQFAFSRVGVRSILGAHGCHDNHRPVSGHPLVKKDEADEHQERWLFTLMVFHLWNASFREVFLVPYIVSFSQQGKWNSFYPLRHFKSLATTFGACSVFHFL